MIYSVSPDKLRYKIRMSGSSHIPLYQVLIKQITVQLTLSHQLIVNCHDIPPTDMPCQNLKDIR